MIMKVTILVLLSLAVLTGCASKHGAGDMSDKEYNRQNQAAEKSLNSL